VTAGDLEDLDLQSSRTTEVMHLVREMRAAGVAAVASAAVDTLEPADGVISRVLEAGLGVARLVVRQPDSSGPWATLDRVRSVHRVAPGSLSFAPLARRQDVDQPTTGYWDVKVIALSRVMLDQQVSLQVDWALHGPKLAQVALLFGADDVDSVPAVPDASLGPRRTPVQEIERNIRDASLTPLERDGRFQPRQAREGT
jgi:aminodeoxyfutalosine synthase